MKVRTVQEMFAYNDWANNRILDAAARIDPTDWVQAGEMNHGSLRGILVHILAAEVLWRKRCLEGISPSQLISEAEFTTLVELRKRWQDEVGQMHRCLESLTDPDLYNVVHYQNTRGERFENYIWQLLVHVINHSTQHRSEAAVVLTALNTSPGDLDMIAFWREDMA